MIFTVCLFVWDDTVDTNEEDLASDFSKATLWRQQSLAYFKYHLQLSPEQQEPECPDTVCLMFKEFGERFCANFGDRKWSEDMMGILYTVLMANSVFPSAQRRRMYAKIKDFVEHCELEQAERLAGRIPNYEQYVSLRYMVTGVRMFALLLE